MHSLLRVSSDHRAGDGLPALVDAAISGLVPDSVFPRSHVVFAGAVFSVSVSEDRFYLGQPCFRAHRWPGTALTLRRRVGGGCVLCSCSDPAMWWLRHVDWSKATCIPSGCRLGKKCIHGHTFRGSDLAVRSASGACIECRRAESIKRRGREASPVVVPSGDAFIDGVIGEWGNRFPVRANGSDYYLGALCRRGHAWPDTHQSLRRNDKRSPQCVGCRSSDGERWWIRFVNWPASSMPQGTRLGSLCRRHHEWGSSGLTLRNLADGRCPACEQIRVGTDRYKEARKASYKRRRLRPECVAADRARDRDRNKRRGESAFYRRQRIAQKAARRARFKAEGLTSNGTVPVKPQCPEVRALAKWLRAPRLSPSVAVLVEKERRRYWRDFPEDVKHIVAEKRRHAWRFQYMTDEGLRIYTREKSKRRKARERQACRRKISPREIRERFAEFRGRCAYCGAAMDFRAAHLEHFIPLSAGGTHTLDNLLLACSSCNLNKAARDPMEWYRSQPFYSAKRWAKIMKTLGKSKCGHGQLSMW